MTGPQARTSAADVALLEALIHVVREVAREAVMPRFLSARRQIKDDGSVLSEADLEAQRLLVERLVGLRSAPVIGEEMSSDTQLAAWQAGTDGLWCVDPIDGTSNFTNGLPFFALSVALLVRGEPVLGVVFNPASDECFAAARGFGATLNGDPLPLRTVTRSLARGIGAIDLKRIPRHLADRIATQPPFHSQRNFGASALEWCYVAAGRIDVYLHGGQMLWDYAAGALILSEAGGRHAPLPASFATAAPEAPGWRRSVVAALNPEVFAAWQDWVAGS